MVSIFLSEGASQAVLEAAGCGPRKVLKSGLFNPPVWEDSLDHTCRAFQLVDERTPLPHQLRLLPQAQHPALEDPQISFSSWRIIPVSRLPEAPSSLSSPPSDLSPCQGHSESGTLRKLMEEKRKME